MQLQFFDRFGKYVFLERLGRGGMAEVYLSILPGAGGINKFFAVKKVVAENSASNNFISMFVEEAKLAVQLQHANVVSVQDFGFENGQFFLVMEFVHGLNLAALTKAIKEKRKLLPIPLAAYMMREVLQGLDYAHRATDLSTGAALNIIHRDVNPQNVMLSYTGDVKLIDFGVAKASTQRLAAKNNKAGLVGKIHYMSPEMVKGETIDPRSDIFSFGVLFWELLTGKKLFEGESEDEILQKAEKCLIPQLKKSSPFVSDELDKIVTKCLKANPAERYATAADVLKDLNAYFSLSHPDFSKRNLESFIRDLMGTAIEESQEKLRKYYNLHFGDASENSALAVPKDQVPIDESTGLHRLDLHQSRSPKTTSLNPRENTAIRKAKKSSTNSKDGVVTMPPTLSPVGSTFSINTSTPPNLNLSQKPASAALQRTGKEVVNKKPLLQPSSQSGYSQKRTLSNSQTNSRKISQSKRPAFGSDLYTGTQQSVQHFTQQKNVLRLVYVIVIAAVFLGYTYLNQKKAEKKSAVPAISNTVMSTPALTNTTGKDELLPLPGVKTISVRGHQGCALQSSGNLSCWGANQYGQLGFGRRSEFEKLSLQSDVIKYSQVSLGEFHGCGVTQVQVSGALRTPVKCWGDNSYDQVGDPTTKFSLVPVTVDQGQDYLTVTTGRYHSCGLTTDRDVKCWGRGLVTDLQKAVNGFFQVPLPEKTQKISSGADHVCSLSVTGKVYCWNRQEVTPALVKTTSVYTDLAAGDYHTCALTLAGQVDCWGKNEFGQLGLGHTEPISSPQAVTTDQHFVELASGKTNSCAIDANRALWCWGRNSDQQIQSNLPSTVAKPTQMASMVQSVSMGDQIICWTDGQQMTCRGSPQVPEIRTPASPTPSPSDAGL